VGLSQEERPEGAALGVELFGVVPQAEEDFLDDLLGQRPIDEEPAGEGEHGARVASVGLGQRLLPVAADGYYEHGVAGVSDLVGGHSHKGVRSRSGAWMTGSVSRRPT
jgi:hypothetical protein